MSGVYYALWQARTCLRGGVENLRPFYLNVFSSYAYLSLVAYPKCMRTTQIMPRKALSTEMWQ